MHNLKINTNIIFGSKSINKIEDILIDKNIKKIAIFLDHNATNKSQIIKKLISRLKNKFKISIYNYKETFEPTYSYIDQITNQIKKNSINFELFICIGGGSVMDTCKAVAVTYRNKGKSIKFRGFPKNLKNPVPVIAVPTTAGTGSEIVYNASIIDADKKIKMGINLHNNYPICAILDPRLIKSAPLAVIVHSAFDTIVHALEGFMSPLSNPITRSLSKESLKISFFTLKKILNGDKKIENYEKMQLSSCLAMMSLSNTSSGATGALSYFLGTNYNVGHGLAGACFIEKICQFNHNNGYYDYAEIYEYLFPKKLKTTKAKSSKFITMLKNLIKYSKISNNIYELGFKDSDINKLITFYKNSQFPFSQNPIKIKIIDIKKIVSSKYKKL